MATLASLPVDFSSVSATDWVDKARFWALYALEQGWTGVAASFLEVGRARIFGLEVDDEFCAEQVARLIGSVHQLDAMGPVVL